MIGIDAVDVERLRTVMSRSRRTEERLFTAREREYCESHADPVVHYAGTLAAKEAVIKAFSLGSLVAWGRRIEVRRNAAGAPEVSMLGRPNSSVDVSISHDGGVAVAIAIARDGGDTSHGVEEVQAPYDERATMRPNEKLLRYIRSPFGNARPCLHDASRSVLGTDFP